MTRTVHRAAALVAVYLALAMTAGAASPHRRPAGRDRARATRTATPAGDVVACPTAERRVARPTAGSDAPGSPDQSTARAMCADRTPIAPAAGVTGVGAPSNPAVRAGHHLRPNGRGPPVRLHA